MLMKDFKGPGFSMKVPTDWYITSTPQIQAMFISPPQEGGHQANFMVTINKLEEDVTLKSVAQEAKKNQKMQYPEYEILNEGFIEGIEEKGFQRVFEWLNEEKSLRVHQKQVMLIVNQMLFVLTTTRPVVDDPSEPIKRLDAQLEMMLQSFKLDGSGLDVG